MGNFMPSSLSCWIILKRVSPYRGRAWQPRRHWDSGNAALKLVWTCKSAEMHTWEKKTIGSNDKVGLFFVIGYTTTLTEEDPCSEKVAGQLVVSSYKRCIHCIGLNCILYHLPSSLDTHFSSHFTLSHQTVSWSKIYVFSAKSPQKKSRARAFNYKFGTNVAW